jgi:hypothetical protein
MHGPVSKPILVQVGSECNTSVPIPKFVSICGVRGAIFGIDKDTSN